MVKETISKPCHKALFHLGQVGEGWEDLAFNLEEFFSVCSSCVLC